MITCAEAEALSGIPASTWRRWASENRITSELRNGRLQLDANQAMRLAKHREHRRRLPTSAL